MDEKLPKVTRVNRYALSRNAREEFTSSQRWNVFQAFVAISFATLIAGALLLVEGGWSPGNQEQIANEYRALRHNAVAMENRNTEL